MGQYFYMTPLMTPAQTFCNTLDSSTITSNSNAKGKYITLGEE